MKKAETKVEGSKQEEIRRKARKNGAKVKGKLEGSRKEQNEENGGESQSE